MPLRRVAAAAVILTAACRGSAPREEEPPNAPAPAPAPTPTAGGSSGPAGSAPPAQVDTPPAGKDQFSRTEYDGWRQYSVHCARCHGQDALGNPVAPDLRQSAKRGGPTASLEAFAQVVKQGRGAMPAFEGQLTDEQIAAMHAYVTGRAEGRLPAGRPEAPAR